MAFRTSRYCLSFRFWKSERNNLQLLALQDRFCNEDIPGKPQDAQVRNLGRAIVDDFAAIRSKYRKAPYVATQWIQCDD